MKKTNSFFKRLTSALLSLAFVITSFAVVDFSKSASIEAKADSDEYFLMAYFTGNGDATTTTSANQAIRFAVSDDGIKFSALNENKPIIEQTGGTKNVRDPYIFQGNDGYYYLIGTDLNAATMSFWGNQPQMVIWRSSDLLTWDNETYINTAQICGLNDSQVYRTWAPQVFYDETSGKYMVYFAFAADGYNSTTMYYMLTDNLLDQSHYSTPVQLYNPGADDIDADITYQNGVYYMFYKDETTGRSTICLATATNVTGPYSYVGQLTKMDETGALEGCEVYTIDGNYYLMADRYGDNGKFAIYNLGNDLSAIHTSDEDKISVIDGNPISTVNATSGFSNLSVRHGSVIHINKAQYDALIRKYGGSTPDDITFCFDKSYTAENSWHYDTINDASGYTFEMMTNSGQYSYVIPQSNYLSLNGATAFCNDATVEEIFNQGNSWTVAFNVNTVQSRGSTLFALTSGDSEASSIDWVRFLDNGKLFLYYDGGYHEVGSTELTTTVDYRFTLSYNGSKIVLYKNGKEAVSYSIASIPFDRTKYTSYVAFGWTDTIGVTAVNAAYSNVRIRSRAITAADAANEYSIDSKMSYQYNEGTSSVNGRDNVTYNSAQTSTTYTGKNGTSVAIAAWINVGSGKDGSASLIEFGDGGTGDNKNYLALLENGQIKYCWNEGSTDHYVDIEDIYNFALNTWYYVQINIVPDGSQWHFCTWVNGELALDKTTGYTRMETYDYGPINFFSRNPMPLYFGKGNVSWWGKAGQNYIDDVRVYNSAVDPAELYRNVEIEDIADDARDYVEANLLSYDVTASANRFTEVAYHQSVVATNAYSNVIYDPIDSTNWTSKDRNGKSTNINWSDGYAKINTDGTKGIGVKMALPSNIVLVRDGVNDVALPAVAEIVRCDSTNTRKFQTIYADHTNKTTNPAPFEFRDYWKGRIDNKGRDGWQLWPADINGTSYVGYAPYYDKEDDFGNSDQNPRYYSNKLYYTGSGDTSNYYEHYSSLVFWIYASSKASGYSDTKFYNDGNNVYIINYEPVYNVLRYGTSDPTQGTKVDDTYNIKAYYNNTIAGHEDEFTTDSLNQFYYAAYKLLTCNPNDYKSSFSSDVSGNVQKAATEIKEAMYEFNNIHLQRKASFTNYDADYDSAVATVNTLGQNNQAKTTSSINALSKVVNGLTYYRTNPAIDRDNVAEEIYQDDIDAEEDVIEAAISALDPMFDFDTAYAYNATTWPVTTIDTIGDNDSPVSYNTMKSMAATALTKLGADDQNKTTSSLSNLQTAYNELTYDSYTAEQKKDLGVKKDGAAIAAQIDNVADKYLLLEDLLSYEMVDEAYATGDATLKAISAEAPKYTTASVNALITAVTNAKSDATASRATRLDNAWSSPKQSAIDDKGRAISSAIENLEVAPEDVTDLSAYEAAVENFEAIMNNVDSDIYESTSFTPANAAIELGEASDNTSYTVGGNTYTIYTIDNSADQTKIESATSNLVSYITNHYKQYKIYLEQGTFAVSADAKLKGGIVEESGTDEFGTYSYTGYANTEIVATANVDTAWYMSYTSAGTARTKQYQTYGKTFINPLIGNMHIFAAQRTNETPNKVTIRRQYSDNSTRPIQCVDFVDGSYTLPTAPAIPFYTFTGYTYGGNTYGTTNDNKTISGITDDIVIIANYEKAATNEYTVKVSSVSGNEDIFNDSAEYNQLITVSDPSAAGWVINPNTANEKLFYVGSSFTFYVCESVEIKGIASLGSYTTPNVNLSPAVTSGGKTTIVGQVVGNDVSIVEYGILVGKSKNGSTLGENDLILKNTGNHDNYSILRAKATKLVGANQFSIGVTGMPAGTYQYRSYLVYEDENELITVYSDVLSTTIA